MLTLVIWLLALVTVIGSSYVTVEGSPSQALDINKVLGLVQQLRLNKPSKQRLLRLSSESSESESSYSGPEPSSDSDDSKHIPTEKRKNPLLSLFVNASHRKGKMNSDSKLVRPRDIENARLAKERIIDLIETVSANEKKKIDRIKNRKGKLNRGQNTYLYRSENYDSGNNNVQKQTLEKLLSQVSNIEERQLKPKKRLIPNRLTPTLTMDDVKKYYENKNKNAEITGLEDYSKVYIVLNPQAVKNSKNKNALNDLISKVLALSSQTPKREPQQVDPFRYKGFVVKRRRVKEVNDNIARMGNDEKMLAPAAAAAVDSSYRITAPPMLF